MNFANAVAEDGCVKDKELVGIFTATFLLLMLFFTKEQPELVYVALALFVILSTIYLYRACVKVAIFTYQKACIIFLQVREQNSQVIGLPSPCVFEIATLKHIAPELLDDSMSVPENTMEPEISSFLESGPAHAIELEHESMALNAVAIDVSSAVEPKILEVIESNSSGNAEPKMESAGPIELVVEFSNAIESEVACVVERDVLNVVEPEILNQYIPTNDEQRTPFAEVDDLTNEAVEKISVVSLYETHASLRAEAYLKVEHAAAYLGLPVESFNEVAKNRSVLPVKKCGAYYLYKINNLDRCVEKLASKAWTQNINVASQEKIISEHGMLTTDKVMIFLNKSKKTLSNWRESRENQNEQPYGPDFIKLNTSVFYNMSALLAWCESPMAKERKPPQKK